ncbi:macrophage mannose receptor 1-like isoform X2 [Plectropomus leopardus]|uniref:macrophage mannose receptor 1-like isoform X2 n=1 Tax=Plectropomus leopardus TaxID=160734 RepID=UPI001C4C6E57|nr:macrophage mannose receptor 1-like isoform X2 [Plectropomus leopardus]
MQSFESSVLHFIICFFFKTYLVSFAEMDCCMTPILLFFGLSLGSCSHFPLRKYYYVHTAMTWTDAQSHCRSKYTDLATFESVDDQKRLEPVAPGLWFWIGLHDDPKSWREGFGSEANSWRWSATGGTSRTGYQNWAVYQPNNYYTDEGCVEMITNGGWTDVRCNTNRRFVCYTVTNQTEKTYVFISDPQKWTDARDYCRKHHTDLAVIESSEENDEVRSLIPNGVKSWIGLHRVTWTWSDKSQSSFTPWRGGSPNSKGRNQFCVTQSSSYRWDDAGCWEEYPFICHQALTLKTTVKMMFETDADMTNQATSSQILQQKVTWRSSSIRFLPGLIDRWQKKVELHQRHKLSHKWIVTSL